MKNDKFQTGIIGGGNLGKAVLAGLLRAGFAPANITVTRRRAELLKEFEKQGVQIDTDNSKAVKGKKLIILAVKPYQAKEVLSQLRSSWTPGQIVVSLMTGIDIASLKDLLPGNVLIFRAMPNTAVAINESMTLLATQEKDAAATNFVDGVFKKLGQIIYIEESLMSAATVLGACGIAFALRFLRAATQGGVEIGFSAEIAQQIVSQTVKGATELVLQTGRHPEQEIDKVTTPKGITISGLNEMEHQGFSSALIRGLLVSYNKLNNGK